MNNKNKAIARIEDLKSIWGTTTQIAPGNNIAVGDVLFADGTITQDVEAKIAIDILPVAICVAPASEFDDYKARFMALKWMDSSAPQTGSDTSVAMMWGGVGVDANIGTFDSENSAKTDVSGYANTQILSNLGSSYQAASCCMLFSPGVYNGEWYLPALGELYYVHSNYEIINSILSRLHLPFSPYSEWVWSSTLYSSYRAWNLYLNLDNDFGSCDFNDKYSTSSVLAFVAIDDIVETEVKGEALEAVENLSTATAAALTDMQFKIDVLQSKIDSLQNQIDNL